MYVIQKNLNGILAVDSPFQETFSSLSKSRIYLINAHLAIFV